MAYLTDQPLADVLEVSLTYFRPGTRAGWFRIVCETGSRAGSR